MQKLKRKLVEVLVLLPFTSTMSAFKASAMGQRPSQSSASDRFSRIALTLVVDAVPGAEMLGVEFFANGDDELRFYAKSKMLKSNREIMAFPSGLIPETVRVTWRDNARSIGRPGKSGIYYGGPIVGDHTFPVAGRIPDEVVSEIRRNGGGLRLKFRLKPDGVLFGWDIERTPDEAKKYSREEIVAKNMYFPPEYHMVGGDFLETRY